jgi:hypothetical protein
VDVIKPCTMVVAGDSINKWCLCLPWKHSYDTRLAAATGKYKLIPRRQP